MKVKSEIKVFFALLFTVNFLITFGYSISDTFFPIIFKDIVGKGITLSLAFILYSVSKILLSPIIGRLMDLYGEIRILGFSLSVYILVSALLLISSDVCTVLIARMIQGAGCAIFRPVIYALISRRAAKDRIGQVSGIMDAAFYSALAAGPFAGGYMIQYFGGGSVKLLLLIVCIAAFLIFVFIKYNLETQRKIFVAALEQGSKTGDLFFFGLLIYIFFRAWSISSLNIYLPVYMAENEFPSSMIGVVLGGAATLTAFSLTITGRLADFICRYYLVSVGGIISAAMILCIPFVHHSWLMFSVTAVSGLFSAVSQPAGVSLLIEHASQDSNRQVFATFNTVMNSGFIFSPLCNAFFMKFFGLNSIFIVAGIFVILAVLLFLSFSLLSANFTKNGKTLII